MKDQKKAAPKTTPEADKKSIIYGIIGISLICALAIGVIIGQKIAKPRGMQSASGPAQITQTSIDAIKQAVLEAQGKQLEGVVAQVKDIAFSERLSIDSGLPLVLLDVPPAGNLPSKGPADAPLTLVEFSDFQCPYCSKMAAKLDEVLAQNPGKIRLIFVDRPLISDRGGFPFHPYAYIAHEAAAAAGAQGKFWEMYDYLFKNQQSIYPPQPTSQEDYTAKQAQFRATLEAAAGTLGLDQAKFKSDLESHAQKSRLDQNIALSESLRINSTPTIMTQAYFKLGDPSVVGRLLGSMKKIE